MKYHKTWIMPEQQGEKATREENTLHVMTKIRSFSTQYCSIQASATASAAEAETKRWQWIGRGGGGTSETGNTGTQEGESQTGTNPGQAMTEE